MILLLLLSLAFSLGTAVVFFATRLVKIKQMNTQPVGPLPLIWNYAHAQGQYLSRPACWLAVKSQKLVAVQTALGINNPTPCGWTEGLEKRLFIAPPVKGWILVIGSGL